MYRFHRDFIERTIEQLSRVMAKLIGLKEEDRKEELQEIIETTLKDLGKIDSQTLEKIPDQDFLETLTKKYSLNEGNILTIAEMLLIKADTFPESSQENYRKAEILFDFLLKNNSVFSLEYYQKLKYIREKVLGSAY